MKVMCSFGYHHTGFVVVNALGHMIHGCNCISCDQAKCMSCHCGGNQEINIHEAFIYIICDEGFSYF